MPPNKTECAGGSGPIGGFTWEDEIVSPFLMATTTPARMIVISTAGGFGKRNSVCIVNLFRGNQSPIESPPRPRQCSCSAPPTTPAVSRAKNIPLSSLLFEAVSACISPNTATISSPMFLQRPAYNTSGPASKKHPPVELALRGRLGLHLAEYRHHLLAELFAVKCRIQPQQTPIDADAEHSIRPPSPRSADLPNA